MSANYGGREQMKKQTGYTGWDGRKNKQDVQDGEDTKRLWVASKGKRGHTNKPNPLFPPSRFGNGAGGVGQIRENFYIEV